METFFNVIRSINFSVYGIMLIAGPALITKYISENNLLGEKREKPLANWKAAIIFLYLAFVMTMAWQGDFVDMIFDDGIDDY
jgi:hypothetical protein